MFCKIFYWLMSNLGSVEIIKNWIFFRAEPVLDAFYIVENEYNFFLSKKHCLVGWIWI